MAAATDSARETAKNTIQAVFTKTNYEILPETRAKRIWEEEMGRPALDLTPVGENDLKPLPTPKDLLELGQRMGATLVCAGRAKWHTKSIWVSLGPKTKADCTVDLILVDVAAKEVVFQADGVKADSTKSESGLESAGAILVSMGITSLSGGPKTPHQKRAAAVAILSAFEPWMKSQANRKIGG
jgi:hypothetical protein